MRYDPIALSVDSKRMTSKRLVQNKYGGDPGRSECLLDLGHSTIFVALSFEVEKAGCGMGILTFPALLTILSPGHRRRYVDDNQQRGRP